MVCGSFPRVIETAGGKTTAPLWVQVADEIEAWATSSEPGDPLPSEAEQTARLGVSRVTLRQALKHVQRKGLVEPHPGLGWFVADPRQPRASRTAAATAVWEPPGKLMGFTEMARLRGLASDSVVLERRVAGADFEESEALRVAPGAPVLHLARVRRMNQNPVAVDRSLVPTDILPDADERDFATGSLHDAFRAAGFPPVHAEVEIEAAVADESNSRLLEVPVGFPVLTIRQAFFSSGGRIIERGYITYRADRYRYRARLRS